jgi:hypothetical protein
MGPKGKAKLARATAIQKIVLRFMRKHRHWDRLTNGPEVIKYQDPVFLIIVSIQDQMPLELRKQFNLGARPRVDPKAPRRFPLTDSLYVNRSSHLPI